MTTSTAVDIRPFRIETPERELTELRRRIAAARWPGKELVEDPSQGVQLRMLQALARYWETEYDWQNAEERLNALPQFTTEIDGLKIHFIHVRSQHKNALPLIITHGWPGSVIEMLEVIEPLTDPTAHGGSAEDAFDLVIPSLPGCGFSGQPVEVGWDAGRTGEAWAELMHRLGYTRYVAQGGDQGAGVTDAMGRQAPNGLLGVHFNFLDAAPRELLMAALNLRLAFSEEDRAQFGKFTAILRRGYIAEMGEHPQTIGYPLLDSPIGLAAWMLDHDADSYDKIAHAFLDGRPSGNLTRDHVLDNITLYWLTNTAASAAVVLGDRAKRD
jgi:pimeloyl-ACP methyl ester carboxylesterase